MSVDQFDRLYRASLMRFFTRRTGDAGVAEDLTQEVFERLLRRGSEDSIDNPIAYIFQIARSVLIDQSRRRAARPEKNEQQFEEFHVADVEFSPEHVYINRERLARTLAIIERLPERTRAIFVLRRIDGMRYRDIAAYIGISVSAVEKHMERAMAVLIRETELDK